MRPVRLELEGFAAFRERTEVDFDGAELFVLCGPTGSGKSSLIDAVCFALYGSVPRYANPGLVHPVISQGRQEARVRFDFTVDGAAYTAVRVVRRTRQGAQTREARLESNGSVLAGSVGELDEKVRELFGLSFNQFTTCVVLPQGDFARFLHDTPADRQELFKELLGIRVYDRMRGLAVGRDTEARQRTARLEGQLEGLSGATPQARQLLEKRVRELEKLQTAADKLQTEMERLDEIQRERSSETEQRQRDAEALERLLVHRGVERLGEEQSAMAAELKSRERARAEAETAVSAAERARKKLPDSRALERLLDAHRDRENKKKELQAAERTELRSRKERERSEQRSSQARKAVAAARERREEIVRANAAHHLVSGLSRGDPCPVCLRPIDKKPKHAPPPGLEKAQQSVVGAEREQQAAEEAAQQALEAHAEDAARIRNLIEAVERLDDTLRGASSMQRLEATLRAIAEADAEVERGRKRLAATQGAEQTARNQIEDLAGRIREAWEHFDGERERWVRLKPPVPDRTDFAGSWRALAAWAAATAAEQREQGAAARAAELRAAERRSAALAGLEEACSEAGVELHGGRPRDLLLHELATAEGRLSRIDQEIEEARKLSSRLAEARSEQAVARALALHLGAHAFERWLFQEAFERLVSAAGERLRELSGGDYSLCVDERLNFEIVDHRNADELRLARTLSGGETFLASLALALTLADQVAELAAQGSARLDSMFLDEGFGTLDPDTLEIVAATMEELGARGRTVGLVTHVQELAQRIPVQYRITKGPSTSVVEKVFL